MNNFVFWVTVFCGFELFCNIVCMAFDRIPERTRGGLLLDTLGGIAVFGWGIYLLAK